MNSMAQDERITLQTSALRCVVALRGAELCSLSDQRNREEFIWQRDPAWWASSAPILFPIIGRLKDSAYTIAGQRYAIPKHGFAREMDFTHVATTETSMTFHLTDTDVTRAQFPFAFLLAVTFTLADRTLAVDYRMVNRSAEEMAFGLGSHPAFNLPPSAGPLTDWSIGFDQKEPPSYHRVTENLLSSAPTSFAFTADNAIDLNDKTFEHDALIFKSIRSRRLTIRHRTQGTRLTFDTGGAPTLGIWANPGAPYVCLEPWWGFDDSSEINSELFAKPALMKLNAGETFTTGYRVTV